MVSAIGALTGSAAANDGTPTRGSPSLDAQLATCRGQLADWVTCPSAKTPEGKAKIAQITDKMDAIRQQIESARKATRQVAPPPAAPRPGATLGGNVDVYA